MTTPKPASGRSNIVGVGLQERRLGSTVLNAYRTTLDIDDIVPNDRQPRLGAKEDEELQRQIVANEGLFEPLLVEPHPRSSRQAPDHRRRTALDQLLAAGQPRAGAVSEGPGGNHGPHAVRRGTAAHLDLHSPPAQGVGCARNSPRTSRRMSC